MENSRVVLFLYTIIFSLSSINSTENNNNLVTNQTALFVFGDSMFDVGNNNYVSATSTFQANFSPYGQTTFKFPSGRFSDGRLITDFIGSNKNIFIFTTLKLQKILTVCCLTDRHNVIAEKAWLPLIPPNLQPGTSNSRFTYGVNFASAGAGALVGTFPGQVHIISFSIPFISKYTVVYFLPFLDLLRFFMINYSVFNTIFILTQFLILDSLEKKLFRIK